MTQKALINHSKLLKKNVILGHNDVMILMEDMNPEFDETCHDELQPKCQEQPGVFRAVQFKIESSTCLLKNERLSKNTQLVKEH